LAIVYINIYQIRKLWSGHDFAATSCCDLDLKGSDLNVARDMSSQYGDHFCEIVLKAYFKFKEVKALTRFCFDLQGSDPTVARNMSSQYGDVRLCENDVKLMRNKHSNL